MIQNKKTIFDLYDTIPSGYYDLVFNKNKGIQSKWHHLKFRFVLDKIGECDSLLDVGCSGGTLLSLLPSRVVAIGVDIAEEQIQYASERYKTDNHKFKRTTPNKPFDLDTQFDVITMVELIEHLSKEETSFLLNECMKNLKPGGRLILTTPNYNSCWPILEGIVNIVADVSYENQHLTKYSRKRLHQLLEGHHFTNNNIHTFQYFASFAAFANWNLADHIFNFENKLTANLSGGNLLLAVAEKPWNSD